VLQLNYRGNSKLSQVKHDYARRRVDQVTPEDAQRLMSLLEWKFATLEELCPGRQYALGCVWFGFLAAFAFEKSISKPKGSAVGRSSSKK
jgi:hypothetical protein